jgi:tetratricopeptide (TPR) repeat protein
VACLNLAELFGKEGKYTEAQTLFNQALEGRRRVLGPDHSATTDTPGAIGELRLQQKQYSEAERLLREAVSGQNKMGESWTKYKYQALLGRSLAGQRKYGEAEPLLLSGYDGLVGREAPIPSEVRFNAGQAAASIIQLYRDWGNTDKLAEWLNKVRARLMADTEKP